MDDEYVQRGGFDILEVFLTPVLQTKLSF